MTGLLTGLSRVVLGRVATLLSSVLMVRREGGEVGGK